MRRAPQFILCLNHFLQNKPMRYRKPHPILPIVRSCFLLYVASNRVPVDKVIHQLIHLIIFIVIHDVIAIKIIFIIIIIIIVVIIVAIFTLIIAIITITITIFTTITCSCMFHFSLAIGLSPKGELFPWPTSLPEWLWPCSS